MACSTCSCSPCNCAQPSGCEECSCVDPGSIPAGRYLPIYDYQTCQKRLVNAAGILVNQVTGSGTSNIVWTSSPCVVLPDMEVEIGTQFPNIMSALGDQGCWHTMTPDMAADGFLRAIGGQWVLSELPAPEIPDPLTVQNLFVNVLATVTDLTVTSDLCAPNLSAGTIVTVVGLDSNGCFVKQNAGTPTPLGVSMAMYYENVDDTSSSVAKPNSTIGNGAYAIIGNELYDADGIAFVLNTQTIEISVAGRYKIEWICFFSNVFDGAYGTAPVARNLNLEINGGTVIPGTGPGSTGSGGVNGDLNYCVTGMTIQNFVASDRLRLKCQGSNTDNRLFKVKMILTRFGS